MASHTHRLLGASRPLTQQTPIGMCMLALDLAKPLRMVGAGLTSDGSLQAYTAYFPPLALTSISHPLAPSRGQIGSWMDAGRRDSRGLLTLAFVCEILGESLAQ